MQPLDYIYDYSVCWQMSPHERASCLYLLDRMPTKKLAVEVGSYCGGFLRHLSREFDRVYSLDTNFGNLKKEDYPNVEFVLGNSMISLPNVVSEIAAENCTLFLIDANHEYNFVYSDLANILPYVPKEESYILIHDSWYPPSRKALIDVLGNGKFPHVHFVDLDFCSGTVTPDGVIVGGICLIKLLPEERAKPLSLRSSDELTYKRLSRDS